MKGQNDVVQTTNTGQIDSTSGLKPPVSVYNLLLKWTSMGSLMNL